MSLSTREMPRGRMIGVLWVLWGLSFLLLVTMWWLALEKSVSSTLKTRRVSALESTPQLEDSFQALQRFGEVMAAASAQEARKELSYPRLLELREQGLPYYRFYYLDANGRCVLASDEELPPEWLSSALPGLDEDETTIRPLPPGYRTDSALTGAPENYLVFARKLENGRWVLWLLDWDYVFGPWLARQLRLFGLGDSLQAELKTWGVGAPDDSVSPRQAEVSYQSVFGSDFRWSWEIPIFLREQPNMLDSLRLTLDNGAAVDQEIRRNLPFLLAGVLLLGGFAAVLWLTSRALRREVEFAAARARFVSQVSHELRTPITALEMYLEILAGGLIDDQAKIAQYHAILKRESHRLKSLVENLLTVGLVESGHWTPRMQPLQIGELLGEVIASENRENRPVEFKDGSDNAVVRGDREALRAVFSNLLQNALKYSPADRAVEIEVSCEGERLEVLVMDRGKGLVQEDYPDLFRPYFRASQAEGPKPGVGLGLSLVKQIVRAHQGEVWGAPREGGGSVFAVQLPLQDG